MADHSNQKGVAHLFLIIILIVGLIVFVGALATQDFNLIGRTATAEPDCKRGKAKLDISPLNAEATAGSDLYYKVIVRNTDDFACGPTLFSFTTDFAVELSPKQYPASIMVDAKDEGYMNIRIASPFGLKKGKYASTLEISGTEGNLHSDAARFTYEVVGQVKNPQKPPEEINNKPIIVTRLLPTAIVNQFYQAEVRAADPDNEDLSLHITNLPVGLVESDCVNTGGDINNAICKITGTPTKAGGNSITVVATDARGLSKTQHLNLKVLRFGIFPF